MNNFGKLFSVSIFGESHGPSVGIVIDGCPPGLTLSPADFEPDLERRRGGSMGTTARREPDRPVLESGIFDGKTTGAPILIRFENTDTRSGDYEKYRDIPRPGHADFVAARKYKGFNDYRGGGRFSGRLTVGFVAAGVIAKRIIAPTTVSARLVEAGGDVDIERAVRGAVSAGDSIGGIVECTVGRVPTGLGEPFFDSAESLISHMLFSIPGVKGVEFGSGFESARMTGSTHNDRFVDTDGQTATNHAGGIAGGITNGERIRLRVAVKPTPSISKPQRTIDMSTGKEVELTIEGRHDACIALRVSPIVEASVAIVLADLLLRMRASG